MVDDTRHPTPIVAGGNLEPSGPNPWAVLLVLCLGFCMILLDTTVVQIAIPRIIDSLHADLDEILWVVNAYILTYAVLLVTAGRLGDMFGQRALYGGGLALFTIASAMCGFAQSTTQLVVARILQGVGGALLTPQTLAVLTTIFPPDRRGAAFGVWGAVAGIAAIAGPTLGGLIVTTWGWRWVFFINLPIGLVAFLATFLVVPDLRTGRRHRMDLIGVVLASFGLLLIIFGLIEGQRFNWGSVWSSVTIPEVIAGGALTLSAFVLWERTQDEPLVPLSLFRDRPFLLMNGVVAAMSFALLGLTFLLPIYLQSGLRLTAFQAGLTVAPMSLALMIVAPFAGRLADRRGGEYLPVVGLLFFAGSMVLIVSRASSVASPVTFVGPMILGGLGIGCVMPPSTTIAMRGISPQMAGAASGVLNTTRQLGGAIGSAVVGALLQNRLAGIVNARSVTEVASLSPQLRQHFVEGFVAAMRPTLMVPIAVLVVAALSCLAIIQNGRAPRVPSSMLSGRDRSDPPRGGELASPISRSLETDPCSMSQSTR